MSRCKPCLPSYTMDLVKTIIRSVVQYCPNFSMKKEDVLRKHKKRHRVRKVKENRMVSRMDYKESDP